MSSPRSMRRFGAAAVSLLTMTACLSFAAPHARAADGQIVLPDANAKFDYQIQDPYTPDPSVRVVDRDRTVKPQPGFYNICYVNLMQTQPDPKQTAKPGEKGWVDPATIYGTASWWNKNHHEMLLLDASDHPVMDDEWHEAVFDVRTPEKRAALFAIQRDWLNGCRSAGFDAVEPDNLESETHSMGMMTHEDVREYLKQVVPYVHSLGLAIAQKNAVGDKDEISTEWATDGPSFVDTPTGRQGFDFAIAEECEEAHECDVYTAMYGGRVFEIEYGEAGPSDQKYPIFDRACAARGAQISVILRDKDVAPIGDPAYLYKEC